MKVAELEGAMLDYWVAKAEGNLTSQSTCPADAMVEHYGYGGEIEGRSPLSSWAPSTEWDSGGPIIERERIVTSYGYNWRADGDCWTAATDIEFFGTRGADCPNACGATLLVAAMRCYVASKFGEEVQDALPESVG